MTKIEREKLYKAAQVLIDLYCNRANPDRKPYMVLKIRRIVHQSRWSYKIWYERESELSDIAEIFGRKKLKPLSMIVDVRDVQEEIDNLKATSAFADGTLVDPECLATPIL